MKMKVVVVSDWHEEKDDESCGGDGENVGSCSGII